MFPFDVDEVSVSPERFREWISPSQAILKQLGEGKRGRAKGSVEAAAANLEHILGKVVIRNEYDEEEEFGGTAMHPFVEAVHLAYSAHLLDFSALSLRHSARNE